MRELINTAIQKSLDEEAVVGFLMLNIEEKTDRCFENSDDLNYVVQASREIRNAISALKVKNSAENNIYKAVYFLSRLSKKGENRG
jgi:hypothetical protein